ncbi:ABC transporter ATP-binding protein [Nocardioides sp. Soil774]|uniref:ABC transporter ATP-binding protein n=1 Tax=Nocardioides sp. Soil774 TaxID=1736408 RepID=UPI00138F0296|nr:ABC transporter ATP-binding protein [Nocardioides sp. Soil774]
MSALVPLMQLLTDQPRDSGALGLISPVLGNAVSDTQLAIVISAVMTGAFVLKSAVSISFQWWQRGFLAEQETNTSARLLTGYLGAPYAMFLRRGTGEFMRTLNEAVSATYGSVVTSSLNVLAESATLIGLAAVMVVASPVAALAALVWFGLGSFVLQRALSQRSRQLGRLSLEQGLRTFHAVVHPVGGAKEIMLRHRAQVFVDELKEARRASARTGLQQSFLSDLPKHIMELLFVTGLAATTVLIFALDPSGNALVTLALFVACATRMLPSLVRITTATNAVRYGMPSTELVVADLHEFTTPLAPAPGHHFPPGDIRVEDVTFTYPASTSPALEDFSIDIPWGTTLAVVGPSGSGKSTFVDVLMGLHSPQSGRITVAGVNVRDDLAAWQSGIGMVPQDVWWVSDTLAANIAFGVPPEERDQKRLLSAVSRAQLTDVVEALPQGLDTMLGERGSRLSGGQRQRVGIARALYEEPTLLVFDEATSALDNLTEHRVTQTLNALHGQTTLVVVAHRLSTVVGCDQLVYVEDGRIAAQGTFEEVRQVSPEFARLVELGSLEAWEGSDDA